jgi:hypothetical protein
MRALVAAVCMGWVGCGLAPPVIQGVEPLAVNESAREIPVAYSVDVVVVGGSTGAVSAAVAAVEVPMERVWEKVRATTLGPTHTSHILPNWWLSPFSLQVLTPFAILSAFPHPFRLPVLLASSRSALSS